MRKVFGIFWVLGLVMTANAQTTVNDRSSVEKLCGCFDVEFKYAETFAPDPEYKYHEREEISGGTELILPIEISDKKIVMQHLLVITDDIIVKHWREVWTYEEPIIWKYQGDMVWTKSQLKPEDVKGKWVQSVWEVSDAPRYQGASDWVTMDGATFWQNTTDAPLPRREYSVRDDYNILKRTNRIIITDSGWVHDQDNQKIIRKDGKDKLLVEEKGINTYKRVSDSQCAPAKKYWEKNKEYWGRVRSVWENYLATHSTVEMKKSVDGKPLHDFLFDLAKDYADGKVKPTEIDAKIKTSIESFFGQDKKEVAQQ
jgi:hypothetical protein